MFQGTANGGNRDVLQLRERLSQVFLKLWQVEARVLVHVLLHVVYDFLWPAGGGGISRVFHLSHIPILVE